jgi:hypothetical protein
MVGKLETVTITALSNGWLVSLGKRTKSRERPWVQSRTAFTFEDKSDMLVFIQNLLPGLDE